MEKLTTQEKVFVFIILGAIIIFSIITKYYSMMV